MKKIFLFISLCVASYISAADSNNVYRAYNNPKGGFVILDNNSEVIGFSSNCELNKDNISSLEFLYGDIDIINNAPATVFDFPAPWQDSIGPLLGDIKYNQGKPYNYMTPTVGDKHCVTGCVATAMAQIMRYWRWPDVCSNGERKFQATKINQELEMSYNNLAFDWDNMLPAYTGLDSSGETQEQWDAVALLMKACGYGVYMGYGVDGSGANSNKVVGAMTELFKYKKNLKLVSVADLQKNSIFLSTLMDEINAGRPIYCDGYENGKTGEDAFHAYVIDGYVTLKGDKNLDYFYVHFNFGWGGGMNGWYQIKGNIDRSIYSSLNLIVGIEPDRATALEDVYNQINDDKIRDILGREVEEMIPGQIYIKNGKKYIAR